MYLYGSYKNMYLCDCHKHIYLYASYKHMHLEDLYKYMYLYAAVETRWGCHGENKGTSKEVTACQILGYTGISQLFEIAINFNG